MPIPRPFARATLAAALLLGGAAHAAELSPLDRLVAQDEIRNKIALYGFYADGDGTGGRGRDLPTLANTLMTPDVVTEIYLARGGPPKIFKGREIVANSPPENDAEKAKRIAGCHYLVSTTFDDISATEAHTRTAAVYFDATKDPDGHPCGKPGETGCGGEPIKTILWVYHMTWRKTPEGWQITKTILRDDN